MLYGEFIRLQSEVLTNSFYKKWINHKSIIAKLCCFTQLYRRFAVLKLIVSVLQPTTLMSWFILTALISAVPAKYSSSSDLLCTSCPTPNIPTS